MKAKVIFLVLMVSVSLVSLTVQRHANADTPKLLRIGAIASLTGPAAEQGKNWLQGAQLAVDNLKDDGINVTLIVEDDATNPGKVASAFQKLKTIDEVSAIIGGTWDFLAETAYPLAKQYKTPFLTPTNPVEILSDAAQQNPWVFTNGLTLAAERAALKEFIVRHSLRRISLVYVNVPFGTSHADLVRSIAKEVGGQIVSDNQLTFEGLQGSIRIAALKIKQNNPDLVFVVADYNGVELLNREFANLKLDPVIMTTQHLDEAFTYAQSPARYRRTYGVYPRFEGAAFVTDFQKKFGHAPKVYAAAGYDALQFLARALAEGVAFDQPKEPFRLQALTGEHLLDGKSRGLVQNKAVIMTTKNGVFEEDR